MTQLICTECNSEYPASEPLWKCTCGGLLDLAFKPIFDLDKIAARKPTMWRYRESLPIEDDRKVVSFDEGFSPLVEVDFADRRILVKQDHLSPTGSYKDRGAAVLISKAHEMGVHKVVEDSSGNAGCAISAYCAKAGIACDIFVPDRTSPGKTVQIELYGAILHRIPGSREDTASAALKAAETNYYASHSYNPFFFHGTKTWAFEVCEQLGWKAPDTVVLPAGNGTLLLGADLGFKELLTAGVIDNMPKIVAIQAEACAPLAAAVVQDRDDPVEIDKRDTVAEGIAIAAPIRGSHIIAAVKDSGGLFITVSDDEIKVSLKDICRQGHYIEPTSAATTAGVSKYLTIADPDELIVSVFTGHGLKSTEKLMKLIS